MIQLQNNYTIPEQSKRLLKLGLPADSADMYYCKMHTETLWSINVIGSGATYTSISTPPYDFMFVPCWSVGRLMEIYDLCDVEHMHKGWDTYFDVTIDYIEFVVRMLEFDIPRGKIDLSRLED